MKLTKKQFCDAVNTYEYMTNEEVKISNTLNLNSEWVPSTWINEYYNLLTQVCELKVDPKFGTLLDWFCYTTDFGKFNFTITIEKTGITWEITSPEILYDFIIANEIEESYKYTRHI